MNDKTIKILNDHIDWLKDAEEEGSKCMQIAYALEELLEATEKFTPKAPAFEGDGYAPDGTFVYDTWICPNCGMNYEVDFDLYQYCPNCGQAIDWKE